MDGFNLLILCEWGIIKLKGKRMSNPFQTYSRWAAVVPSERQVGDS
jgi:hypothetical protein